MRVAGWRTDGSIFCAPPRGLLGLDSGGGGQLTERATVAACGGGGPQCENVVGVLLRQPSGERL